MVIALIANNFASLPRVCYLEQQHSERENGIIQTVGHVEARDSDTRLPVPKELTLSPVALRVGALVSAEWPTTVTAHRVTTYNSDNVK